MSVALDQTPEPHTDVDSIPAAVARVRAGFDSGRTRPETWRREQLAAIKALVLENADAFEAALAADVGKPPLEGFLADVGTVAQEAAAASKQLKRWMKPEKIATPMNMKPARSRLIREPLGVALIISPWNYPIQLLLSPLVGAVAAGNAAVLKPSELTPRVSAELARTVPRYLDEKAIVLVEGGVEETRALLEERFDHIFYTGNGRVAHVVMEAAAKHLTPVTLELGGKSPCIIAEDANVQLAARRIAWGKFVNAGQTCIAPDYVLCHTSRESELIDELQKAVTSFYGDDPHKSPDYARVVNTRHHQRLTGMLKDADVAFGGQHDEADRYLAPTVLRNVGPDSPAMQEEIFGPILPVLTVPSVDEAVAFVNERDKPLALYVFTEDDAVEEDVLARTSSGGACVNGTIWQVAHPNLPFGGVGPSGMGAYHGKASFETFSHRKAVVSKGTRFDLKMMYPPYGAFKLKMIKRMLG